jgi:cytoskeleton protein RodZ
MNMTESLHETEEQPEVYPGQFLAKAREAKGLTQEYVAGKLHLRTQVVHLLETDAYEALPQPVFIQGYYRAYAKLLGIDPQPVLDQYNLLRVPETKIERILRQRDREPGLRAIHLTLILSGLMFMMLIGAFFWWSQSAPNAKPARPTLTEAQKPAQETAALNGDLMQMDMGLSLPTDSGALERHDG